jgi:hypothetical protein
MEGFTIMVCIVQLRVLSVCIGRLHECQGGSFQFNLLAADFANPGTCLSGLLVCLLSGFPQCGGRPACSSAIVLGSQPDTRRAGGWLGHGSVFGFVC